MKNILSSNFLTLSLLIFSFSSTFSSELGLRPSGIAQISFRVHESYNYSCSHICDSIDVPYYSITSSTENTDLNLLDTFTPPLNPDPRILTPPRKPTQEETNNSLRKTVKKEAVSVLYSHDIEKVITAHVHKTYPKFQNKEIIATEYGPWGTYVYPNDKKYVLHAKSIQEHYIHVHFGVVPPKQDKQQQQNASAVPIEEEKRSSQSEDPFGVVLPKQDEQQQNTSAVPIIEQEKRSSQSKDLFSKLYYILSLRWILQAIYAISERL